MNHGFLKDLKNLLLLQMNVVIESMFVLWHLG